MQYAKNFPSVTNVGYIDTTLRALLGVAALTPALMQIPPSFWEYTGVSALVSIYPLMTALYRWDPLYQIFSVCTTKDRFEQEKVIDDFLVVSGRHLSSLVGTTRVNNAEAAANDYPEQRKSA